eukprot:280041_1
MRAMNIFHYMVDGYPLAMRVKKRDVRILRSLIKEEQHHTLLKGSQTAVPTYFLTFFHYFLNKLDYVDINLNHMETEYRGTNRHKTVFFYGFKVLVPLFCVDNNPKALNYALLCSVMPSVKSFTVWCHPQGSEVEESAELSKEFVASVIQAIVLDTCCEAFHILVPSITDSPSLQDWINKNQKAFHKYGWTLKQDKAFKHPRR